MKIYAKQTPLEFKTSPIEHDVLPDNIYLYGNRHLLSHGAEIIETLKSQMYDAADELTRLLRGLSRYQSFIDIVDDFLPAPEHKNEYARADRLKWRDLLLDFDEGVIDDDAAALALELITGEEYSAATIRGCCQGEWSNIIYPTKYGRDWLRDFEIDFFNLGDEYAVYYCDDETDADDAESGEYIMRATL